MTKKSLSFLLVATTLTIAAAQTSCTSQPRQDSESLKREAVLENIHQRKSVRDYTTQPVEDEKTNALLEAAMAAPSGKDTRPWHFVVINDRARLDSMAAELGNAKMLAKAPMAIVICGDSTVSSYWYLDCSLAGENLLLAAEAMGLGAVWTAAFPYEDRMEVVRRHINLPENILPLCVIPIGYPAGDNRPKEKFNAERIHWNIF